MGQFRLFLQHQKCQKCKACLPVRTLALPLLALHRVFGHGLRPWLRLFQVSTLDAAMSGNLDGAEGFTVKFEK